MTYKGYTGVVEFDDAAGIFHGRVLHLRDVITFQGTSVEELRREFQASIDDYLEWCAERGEAPEKPASGKILLRMGPELHQEVSTAAARSGASLNDWIVRAIEKQLAPALGSISSTVPKPASLSEIPTTVRRNPKKVPVSLIRES